MIVLKSKPVIHKRGGLSKNRPFPNLRYTAGGAFVVICNISNHLQLICMKKNYTAWILLAAGCLFLAVSLYIFLYPWSGYLKLIKFAGIALLLNSVHLVMHYYAVTGPSKTKPWIFAEAILDIVFGCLLLLNPLFTFLAFAFLIGLWAACWGLLKLTVAWITRHTSREWIITGLAGLLAVVFGLLLLYKPFNTVADTTTLIALFTLVTGLLSIVDAYRFAKGNIPHAIV